MEKRCDRLDDSESSGRWSDTFDLGDVIRDTMCARVLVAGEEDDNRVDGASAGHAGRRRWNKQSQVKDKEVVTALTKGCPPTHRSQTCSTVPAQSTKS